MNLFRVISKVSIHCHLPFKESVVLYTDNFVSEKTPLVALSNVCSEHPWLLEPYKVAEELTLSSLDRIKNAPKNSEICFFKSEKMLDMEVFSPLRGEFVQNDYEKLAILDSFKVLIFLFMKTFHVNTCLLCQGQENTKCKGTCGFQMVESDKHDQYLSLLFSNKDGDTQTMSKLKGFSSKKVGPIHVGFDWKTTQMAILKNLRLVLKHKNFIPKKSNCSVVQIDEITTVK